MNNKQEYERILSGLDESMPDGLYKLARLLEGQCVEFINDNNAFRAVYLANDCTESFLNFIAPELNGVCLTDYDGYISASVERFGDRFLLVFRQGEDNTFTVTFSDVAVETYMYNYGNTGHFWVDGFCDLRLIDYWLGIINDKYNCLSEYCNDEEVVLAVLSQFRPLRYYNSVPEKYMADSDYVEYTTAESVDVFLELAREASDFKMCRFIEKHGVTEKTEKRLAKLLAKPGHSTLVNLIIEKIASASAQYPDREYGEKTGEYRKLYDIAVDKARQYAGKNCTARAFREEPFAHMPDSMTYKTGILLTKNGFFRRKYRIIEWI